MAFDLDLIRKHSEDLIQNLQSNIQTYAPSVDSKWILVAFVVFILIIITFSLGRPRIVSAIIAMYISAFIFNHIPKHFFTLLTFSILLKTLLTLLAVFFATYYALGRILKHAHSETSVPGLLLVVIAQITLGFLIFSDLFSQNVSEFIPENIVSFVKNENIHFIASVLPIAIFYVLPLKKGPGRPSS